MPTAITQDWQARLVERDFLIGRGTNYPGIGAISGLGLLQPDQGAIPRYRDGDVSGRDRLPARIINLPVVVIGDTAALTWSHYRALAVGWRRSSSDLELTLRIPGSAETVMSYFGRPLGSPGEPHGLKGSMLSFVEFRAGPYAYGAAHNATDSSSPMTIPLADLGDVGANTNRVTLTITGNGGTPVVTNTTTGGVLSFTQVLAGAATIIVDLSTQTATKAGLNIDNQVSTGADWFELAGGVDNVLTFTGCASVRVDWRPAYQVI